MAWAPDYVTTEELAAFVRIGDSADDVALSLAAATASRVIDRATGRQFGRVEAPTARFYSARHDVRRGRWVLDIDDLMTTEDLEVGVDDGLAQTWSSTVTDHILGPPNAAADGRPWTELTVRSTSSVQPTTVTDGVRVTARWGWSGIPDAIRQACLLQASRLLSRRDSPFGIAGSPEMGSELRLLERLDPDVAIAVRPYRRMWGAV